MSNTKQKIEESRQELDELEQQLESEQYIELIESPFKKTVGGSITGYISGCLVEWVVGNDYNVSDSVLFESVKKVIQLESWVLSNIRAGEKRDYGVYYDGHDWYSLNETGVGTICMPERLAENLRDKLNSGEWKL